MGRQLAVPGVKSSRCRRKKPKSKDWVAAGVEHLQLEHGMSSSIFKCVAKNSPLYSNGSNVSGSVQGWLPSSTRETSTGGQVAPWALSPTGLALEKRL